MKIQLGDMLAKTDEAGEAVLGSVTEIEQNWVPLFKIEWDDGTVWRVKEEVAVEHRKIFFDTF